MNLKQQIILRNQWSQNRTRPTQNGEKQLEQVIARQHSIHKDIRAWNWIVIYTDNNGQSQFPSVQLLSRVWLCDPHELQHTRPPCPSPTPRVYPNSCPLSWWCHPTISSPVVPFSSCPQFFPPSWSFQMSQLFTSGGQSIGVSASTSILPMNTQVWSLLGRTGWISLLSKGLPRVFSSTMIRKLSLPYGPNVTSIHD